MTCKTTTRHTTKYISYAYSLPTCIYMCTNVRTYVCMYVCMFVYVCMRWHLITCIFTFYMKYKVVQPYYTWDGEYFSDIRKSNTRQRIYERRVNIYDQLILFYMKGSWYLYTTVHKWLREIYFKHNFFKIFFNNLQFLFNKM